MNSNEAVHAVNECGEEAQKKRPHVMLIAAIAPALEDANTFAVGISGALGPFRAVLANLQYSSYVSCSPLQGLPTFLTCLDFSQRCFILRVVVAGLHLRTSGPLRMEWTTVSLCLCFGLEPALLARIEGQVADPTRQIHLVPEVD